MDCINGMCQQPQVKHWVAQILAALQFLYMHCTATPVTLAKHSMSYPRNLQATCIYAIHDNPTFHIIRCALDTLKPGVNTLYKTELVEEQIQGVTFNY